MKTQKNFNYKQVDMLITARTILKSFDQHKVELLPLRDNWSQQYINDLKDRINYALSHHLGQDSRSSLKIATKELTALQTEALKNLGIFKIQLEMDFSNNKTILNELLNTLGFSANYTLARKGDQEALIQLLYTFKENLSSELRTQITEKGITNNLLDNIVAFADPLREADVDQENFKTVSKVLTKETIDEFNAIYTEIMTICKVASKIFANNIQVKDKFTFKKVASALNNKRKKLGIEGIEHLSQIENQIIDPNLRDDLNPDAPPVS